MFIRLIIMLMFLGCEKTEEFNQNLIFTNSPLNLVGELPIKEKICEENSRYLECITFLDEISCRLQLCPILPLENEIRLINDYVEIIGPKDYEKTIEYYIKDSKICYNYVASTLNYFGQLPIRRRLVLVENREEMGSIFGLWGPSEIPVIVTYGTDEFFKNIGEIENDNCDDEHEITHFIVQDLPIPLEEGLTTTMQHLNDEYFICEGTGYIFYDESVEYVNLVTWENNSIYYLTAACVWRMFDIKETIKFLSEQKEDFYLIRDLFGNSIDIGNFGIKDIAFYRSERGWREVLIPN